MKLEEMFRWRKSSEEVPVYQNFGHSLVVIGVDKHRDRGFYRYVRGQWMGIDDSIPVFWHYLPQRPSIEEIAKLEK